VLTRNGFLIALVCSSKKTDARANAQRLSRSAAVACFRCLLAEGSLCLFSTQTANHNLVLTLPLTENSFQARQTEGESIAKNQRVVNCRIDQHSNGKPLKPHHEKQALTLPHPASECQDGRSKE
jgi:hypothetical protein